MTTTPLKLHLGCGGNRLEGWLNHDAELDVFGPLPFGDNEFEAVFCEHILEHHDHPHCLAALREIYRVLKPGGVFRLCIPVLDRIEDEQHARDLIANHGHRGAFTKSLVVRFLQLSGFAKQGIQEKARSPLDGHWRVIGREKDDRETFRVEALK